MALFSGLGGGLAAAAGGYSRGQVLGEERGYKRLQAEEDRAYKKELLRLKKAEGVKDPYEDARKFSQSEATRLQGLLKDKGRQQWYGTAAGAKELERDRKALAWHLGVVYRQIDPRDADQPFLSGLADERDEGGPLGPPAEEAARTQATRAAPFLSQPGAQPAPSLEMLAGAIGSQPGAPGLLSSARGEPKPDVWQTTPPVWPWGQQPPPAPLPRGDGISIGLPPGQGMGIPTDRAPGPPLPPMLGPPDISAQLRPKPKLAPPPTAAKRYSDALNHPYVFKEKPGEYPEAAAERRKEEEATWRQNLEALRQAKVEEEASPERKARGVTAVKTAEQIEQELREKSEARRAGTRLATAGARTAESLLGKKGRLIDVQISATEKNARTAALNAQTSQMNAKETKRAHLENERNNRLSRQDLKAYRDHLVQQADKAAKQTATSEEARLIQEQLQAQLAIVKATKDSFASPLYTSPEVMAAQAAIKVNLDRLKALEGQARQKATAPPTPTRTTTTVPPPPPGKTAGSAPRMFGGNRYTWERFFKEGKGIGKRDVDMKAHWITLPVAK